VTKEVRDNRTITRIEPLTGAMRVESLAHLMAGTVTEAVRASAREMLAVRRGESKSPQGESEDVAKGESESLPGKAGAGRKRSAPKGKRRG
jgi:hypothetical protein